MGTSVAGGGGEVRHMLMANSTTEIVSSLMISEGGICIKQMFSGYDLFLSIFFR